MTTANAFSGAGSLAGFARAAMGVPASRHPKKAATTTALATTGSRRHGTRGSISQQIQKIESAPIV